MNETTESIQTRCVSMKRHVTGDLLIPCPDCRSIKVTTQRLPQWQPEEREHTTERDSAMSIGALKEGIINATELEGVFGQNVHESKDVVLRIDGRYYPLRQVSVGFLSHTGRITMFLEGGDPL